MSNTISITGNLGQNGELKFLSSGAGVFEFNVADTPGRFNRDTNKWEDTGDTNWFRISVWGALGEALANANIAVKGAQATITGTLNVRTYEHNGETRTSLDVRADTVGFREKRGATQAQPQAQPAASGSGVRPDPWATDTTQDGFTDEPPY